jgi:hypothetical protein
MPADPTITDDAVTARWTSHGWWTGDGPEPLEGRPSRRARCGGPDLCATCKTEAADQPTTTDEDAVDSLIAEHAAKLQQIYDRQTAGNATFIGVLAAFAYALVPLLARQSADRDTETAAQAVAADLDRRADDLENQARVFGNPHPSTPGAGVVTTLLDLAREFRSDAAALRGRK